MQKIALYFTIFCLVIISIGYFKNAVSLFSLMSSSRETSLYTAPNWRVATIDPDLQTTLKLQSGDSITRVDQNSENDFVSLNNQLVQEKGKTVEIEVIRSGMPVILSATIPSDFQSYLHEKRVTFLPQDKGDPSVMVMTPFLRNRLMTGEAILLGMGVFSLYIAVLIYLEKRIAWFLGALLVVLGILGSLEFETTIKSASHAIFFIALAIGLVISYQKESFFKYLRVLLIQK